MLYELDRPIFHAWRVFGRENQEDYEQEAFIWIHRALETFDPTRGAFLRHLKDYVKKAKEAFYAKVNNISPDAKRTRLDRKQQSGPERVNEKLVVHGYGEEDEEAEEHNDAFFWEKVKS